MLFVNKHQAYSSNKAAITDQRTKNSLLYTHCQQALISTLNVDPLVSYYMEYTNITLVGTHLVNGANCYVAALKWLL